MKNAHIGCIVLATIAALLLAFYLGNDIKQKEVTERHELLSDTAAANSAQRTYQRIHHQQLMEDEDYSELYYECKELRTENEKLRNSLLQIQEYADDIDDELEYFRLKGFDVSSIEDLISDIESECYNNP